MEKEKIMPSAKYAFLTLGTIVVFMVIGINFFNIRIEVMMFLSWLIVVPFAKRLGYSFEELEVAAYDMVRKGLQAVTIIFAVGMLIGTWIAAGTVPTLIYYGLKVISPKLFLVTALILCSIVALATGTSWGTMGTCGIAMMGIGAGIGIPAGITAGAVVSGAYFGDKMSPLSDSTNLSAAVSGTDVVKHIKNMFPITILCYVISFVIYLVLGFKYGSGNADLSMIDEIIGSLESVYNIGIVALLPALIVIILLIRGHSPITSILSGSLAGFFVGVLYQGFDYGLVAKALYTGFAEDFGSDFLNELLNRGGLLSMSNIASIMVSGLGLGGMLRSCGVLQAMLDVIAKRIKSVFALVGSTMIVAYLANMIGGSMSFATVMTGTLMSPLYEKFRLKPENLAATIQSSATLGAPLIPWNSNALFAMSMLQVTYKEYIGFAFFNFIDPIVFLIFAFLGIRITQYTDAELEAKNKA